MLQSIVCVCKRSICTAIPLLTKRQNTTVPANFLTICVTLLLQVGGNFVSPTAAMHVVVKAGSPNELWMREEVTQMNVTWCSEIFITWVFHGVVAWHVERLEILKRWCSALLTKLRNSPFQTSKWYFSITDFFWRVLNGSLELITPKTFTNITRHQTAIIQLFIDRQLAWVSQDYFLQNLAKLFCDPTKLSHHIRTVTVCLCTGSARVLHPATNPARVNRDRKHHLHCVPESRWAPNLQSHCSHFPAK